MAQWDAERAERWMRDQAQRSEVYGTATEKMLELAEIRTADRVLDVAAGAGDHSLLRMWRMNVTQGKFILRV